MKKTMLLLIIFVSGCQTTQSFSPGQKELADKIQLMMNEKCILKRTLDGYEQSAEKTLFQVLSVTNGQDGWVSATAQAKGMMDNFYYRDRDGTYFCGSEAFRKSGRTFIVVK